MAGHTSEKRWRRNQNPTFGGGGVSEQVSDVCLQMIAVLTQSKALFDEMAELYSFAGGTVQDLADQLFKEDWEVRSNPGVNAAITVDVIAGVVSNPVITTAGTGYTDGTNFVLSLISTAGGGDGMAELLYDVVGGSLTNISLNAAGTTYNNGTGVPVLETPLTGLIFETQANAEEFAKAQDLFDAVTALKEVWDAASNIAVVTEDRFAQIRRMT